MISVKSFGSGSKGNIYLVSNAETNILLEVGVDIETLNKFLNSQNKQYKNINAWFTTHHHQDHSLSLKHIDDYNIKCYCTYDTKIRYNISDDNFIQLIDDKVYKINTMQLKAISVNHGATECFGFIIRDKDETILFITDFMECRKKLKIFNFSQIFIECNYIEANLEYEKSKEDNEEELDRKYKRQLNTHCSLENLVIHLNEMNLTNCDKITLIHISQDLGDKDLMKNTIEEEFGIECVALLPNGIEY